MTKMSAASAERLAGEAVEFVRGKLGVALPYTPESLIIVDAMVDKVKDTGATEEQASSLLLKLGCYAGEVFVRHAKGSWRPTAEMRTLGGSSAFVLVMALPGPVSRDVIGEVFRRFREGGDFGVAAMFESLHAPGAPAPAGPAQQSARR